MVHSYRDTFRFCSIPTEKDTALKYVGIFPNSAEKVSLPEEKGKKEVTQERRREDIYV